MTISLPLVSAFVLPLIFALAQGEGIREASCPTLIKISGICTSCIFAYVILLRCPKWKNKVPTFLAWALDVYSFNEKGRSSVKARHHKQMHD